MQGDKQHNYFFIDRYRVSFEGCVKLDGAGLLEVYQRVIHNNF